NQVDIPQKVEALQDLKLQLYRRKSENRQLEIKIASVSMQLQKKQSLIDANKEKISEILEQKQNTDENCDMFMELQQKMQKKLEYVNRRLLEEKNKLKECEEEKAVIIQQVEQIAEEKNKLKKELETEKNKSIVERLLKG
ncbi:MAG TPA: hypothetical protein VM577_19515, partial [Anaerovoracaceae bacterium]|nr:hypothetical protein [Anaerovoracaceae bacterium]